MPKFPKNTSPAMYKSSGFKMKNSALHKSAKYGSPMQGTFDKVKKAGGGSFIVGMGKTFVDSLKDTYNKSGIVINKSNKNPKGVKFPMSKNNVFTPTNKNNEILREVGGAVGKAAKKALKK